MARRAVDDLAALIARLDDSIPMTNMVAVDGPVDLARAAEVFLPAPGALDFDRGPWDDTGLSEVSSHGGF